MEELYIASVIAFSCRIKGKLTQMGTTVLMVAEKPLLADSIAKILSNNTASKRKEGISCKLGGNVNPLSRPRSISLNMLL
ncbi:hypothetical protein DICVIV_09360 [Dictyocaulus viviparus]|uniref:Uncharacterized protein n=1 Tax=Dictyocaulus viviparus TaxID=29172 RepID=A0A0D8XJ60_DICVI|nr:hypothetical protein DICVIV_09360 [Dictyocaulus viviparus]